jgi:hypothetical protein
MKRIAICLKRTGYAEAKARSHLKNVFWPPAFGGIGAELKILDIQPYASGLRPTKIIRSDGESRNEGKLGPAARVPAEPLGEDGILNQNPIFVTGSDKSLQEF